MTNSNYKLTKEDFNQINKRSLFTFQLGWNYERMQASGYLYMILPQLRKMYGDGTPELKEMMKVHTQFFNTSPFFHTIIAGFDLAMEEKDGVGSKDAVNGIKTGLMGPFAPLGDTIFGSLVPAIMGSVAATMAIAGQPWGIFLCALYVAFCHFGCQAQHGFHFGSCKGGCSGYFFAEFAVGYSLSVGWACYVHFLPFLWSYT